MLRLLLIAICACWLLASCDSVKKDADDAAQGGQNAVGIADKMKGGTVGDADSDSGESSSDGG
jgi:hypothetical protein